MINNSIWTAIFIGSLSLSTEVCFAQKQPIIRDSSFTVESTFLKEKKKYPFIEIANVKAESIRYYNDIVYKKIEGRELHLDIFNPDNTGNGIALILIHGGGWRSGDKSHMHNIAKALALKGYTCYAVEYRLSLEAPYPAGIIDLKDAISWVKKTATTYNTNPQKVVCLGTSSGGQMAALLGSLNMTKDPNSSLYAVINIDGLLSFHHPDAEEGTMAAQWLNGNYSENPNHWIEASALTHVSPESSPMLFINSSIARFSAGKNDFIAKYKAYSIPYDDLLFENSPHTFWYFHPWFIPTINKIDEFLQYLHI